MVHRVPSEVLLTLLCASVEAMCIPCLGIHECVCALARLCVQAGGTLLVVLAY